MIRRTKKIRKLRGSRTIGGGCSKKRRGAGHRGGRGNAGLHKSKWTWTVKYDPKHFGKYGFKRPPRSILKFNPVNLDYLDEKSEELVNQGLALKKNGAIEINVTDLGYNKVLGKGKVNRPLIVKSPKFSSSAIQKIEEAGGEIVTL
ncbi:MAG: 50S ribosomal protein L15 [Methanobacterium sp.]|uniref:uL15m family ribosomal protein n=1 Tax=Methanobacterium sp. TaxID=2164 RepID=UPI003D650AAF|nr:50S ribosomal protein L15 [Methanobacterium sp.]